MLEASPTRCRSDDEESKSQRRRRGSVYLEISSEMAEMKEEGKG